MWRSVLCKRKQQASNFLGSGFATQNITSKTFLERWFNKYEDFIGLTAVKSAQQSVIQAETHFVAIQKQRRERQLLLSSIQARLKKLNAELEKIPRTDDRYLKLLTEEHAVIKDEQHLIDEVDSLETQEREQFTMLSTALRDSHEKESAQAERTKYWSIAGSLIGACIGIIGTSVNNRLRMRELRSMITSRDTTPVITEKLGSIELGLDEVNQRLSQVEAINTNISTGTDSAVPIVTSNEDLHKVEHRVASDMVLQRIEVFEKELVKTAVSAIVTLTILFICNQLS